MSGSLGSFVPARARFRLGHVMVTEKACQLDPTLITDSLHRHARGDFGPIHDFHGYNDRALRQGGDITSAYLDPRSERFFLVVTTAQQRRTVVMLPEEYGPAHRRRRSKHLLRSSPISRDHSTMAALRHRRALDVSQQEASESRQARLAPAPARCNRRSDMIRVAAGEGSVASHPADAEIASRELRAAGGLAGGNLNRVC